MSVKAAFGPRGTGIVKPTSSDGGDAQEQQRQEVYVTERLLMEAMWPFSPITEQARDIRESGNVCITFGGSIKPQVA